jgi:cytoskeletal protein RodZ
MEKMTTTAQPGEFGKALRAAREKTGMDLRALSDLTKIPYRYLEAIENEDWASAPKGVHGRGFVKIIARELGADVEGLLALYHAARSEEPPAPRPKAELDWRMGAEDMRKLSLPRFVPTISPRLIASILGVVLALGVLLWVWSPWKTRPAPLPSAPVEAPETVAPPAAEPAPAAETAPPPADEVHRLEVRALAATHFRLEGEGLLGDPVNLGKGESATFDVSAKVRVLADPAAVEVTWDGTPVTLPPSSGGRESAVELPPAAKGAPAR